MSLNKFEITTYLGDTFTHIIGNKYCNSCYYPSEVCRKCETGLVHSQFVDEENDTPIIKYVCNNCKEV